MRINYFLASEVALVKTATDAYNVKIKAVATAKVSFVDANALIFQLLGLRLMDLQ
jgi:hypothetical protein